MEGERSQGIDSCYSRQPDLGVVAHCWGIVDMGWLRANRDQPQGYSAGTADKD